MLTSLLSSVILNCWNCLELSGFGWIHANSFLWPTMLVQIVTGSKVMGCTSVLVPELGAWGRPEMACFWWRAAGISTFVLIQRFLFNGHVCVYLCMWFFGDCTCRRTIPLAVSRTWPWKRWWSSWSMRVWCPRLNGHAFETSGSRIPKTFFCTCWHEEVQFLNFRFRNYANNFCCRRMDATHLPSTRRLRT